MARRQSQGFMFTPEQSRALLVTLSAPAEQIEAINAKLKEPYTNRELVYAYTLTYASDPSDSLQYRRGEGGTAGKDEGKQKGMLKGGKKNNNNNNKNNEAVCIPTGELPPLAQHLNAWDDDEDAADIVKDSQRGSKAKSNAAPEDSAEQQRIIHDVVNLKELGIDISPQRDAPAPLSKKQQVKAANDKIFKKQARKEIQAQQEDHAQIAQEFAQGLARTKSPPPYNKVDKWVMDPDAVPPSMVGSLALSQGSQYAALDGNNEKTSLRGSKQTVVCTGEGNEWDRSGEVIHANEASAWDQGGGDGGGEFVTDWNEGGDSNVNAADDDFVAGASQVWDQQDKIHAMPNQENEEIGSRAQRSHRSSQEAGQMPRSHDNEASKHRRSRHSRNSNNHNGHLDMIREDAPGNEVAHDDMPGAFPISVHHHSHPTSRHDEEGQRWSKESKHTASFPKNGHLHASWRQPTVEDVPEDFNSMEKMWSPPRSQRSQQSPSKLVPRGDTYRDRHAHRSHRGGEGGTRLEQTQWLHGPSQNVEYLSSRRYQDPEPWRVGSAGRTGYDRQEHHASIIRDISPVLSGGSTRADLGVRDDRAIEKRREKKSCEAPPHWADYDFGRKDNREQARGGIWD